VLPKVSFLKNLSNKCCIAALFLIILFMMSACVDPVVIEYSVAWNPNNSTLAVVGSDLRLYSESFETATVLEKTRSRSQVAWSPDGSYLITAGKGIEIWDIKAKKLVISLMSQTYFVSVAWSRDGSKIAIGGTSGDKSVRIFNGKTFSLITTLVSHMDQVNTVAWSPDSTKLASGSFDGTVIIWEATTGKKISTFRLPKGGSVTSVAWSPSGKKFAVGSLDQTLRFLDINTWQLDKQLIVADGPFWVNSIAWSPDEKQIATVSISNVKIWDVATAQLFMTLQVPNGSFDSVSWSSDGTKIATVGKGNTLHVWNAITGEVAAIAGLN
jgi:WD40 repeat protein